VTYGGFVDRIAAITKGHPHRGQRYTHGWHLIDPLDVDTLHWDPDTRQPSHTTRQPVRFEGHDTIPAEHRDRLIQATTDAYAKYPPGYRAPRVHVTAVDNPGNAAYDMVGIKVGKDRIQVQPAILDGDPRRRKPLVDTMRHEVGHRADRILQQRVEARDGHDAASEWRRQALVAAEQWGRRALVETPDDPRLADLRTTIDMHDRGSRHAHAAGGIEEEALAEAISRLVNGETLPGDPAPLVALIREADPDLLPVA